MTLDYAQPRDIRVLSTWRASGHEIVSIRPEHQLVPHLSSGNHGLEFLIFKVKSARSAICEVSESLVDQTSIDVRIASVHFRIGLLDQEWPDFFVAVRVSANLDICMHLRVRFGREVVVNSDYHWLAVPVHHYRVQAVLSV